MNLDELKSSLKEGTNVEVHWNQSKDKHFIYFGRIVKIIEGILYIFITDVDGSPIEGTVTDDSPVASLRWNNIEDYEKISSLLVGEKIVLHLKDFDEGFCSFITPPIL
jgi:hypothetical protein